MQGKRHRKTALRAVGNSIHVLGPSDIVAEAEKMARRRPAQLRQFFLAMRAVNQIDDGETPDLVVERVMPMLDSGDGLLS
jgi:hypothetical protein